MYLRLNLIQKKWKRLAARKEVDASESDILFVRDWVDSLHYNLVRYKNDKEFIGDLVESAYKFYDGNLNDLEKTDAFFYFLGKISGKS